MNKRDEQLLNLYQEYRYKGQFDWYGGRVEEFDAARSEFVNISTVLMILAALMGILSSIDVSGLKVWWAVLSVIFPTLSAALSTYNGLYAFERQAKIYQDAVTRLSGARVYSPEVKQWKQEGQEAEYHQAVENYIKHVEEVFREERGQWGLLADEIKGVEPPLTSG